MAPLPENRLSEMSSNAITLSTKLIAMYGCYEGLDIEVDEHLKARVDLILKDAVDRIHMILYRAMK